LVFAGRCQRTKNFNGSNTEHANFCGFLKISNQSAYHNAGCNAAKNKENDHYK
jgi:hypothetical protein